MPLNSVLCSTRYIRSGPSPVDHRVLGLIGTDGQRGLYESSSLIHQRISRGRRAGGPGLGSSWLASGKRLTNKAWVADQQFVRHSLNVAREFLCNVLLVTHPEKSVEDPNLQNVAGGASYRRISVLILGLLMNGHAARFHPVSQLLRTICGVVRCPGVIR